MYFQIEVSLFFYNGLFHLGLHYILVLYLLLVKLEIYFPKSGCYNLNLIYANVQEFGGS